METKAVSSGIRRTPNYLHVTPFGEPKRIITRAGAGMLDSVAPATRIPPGHPEGYLEGFANLYNDAADVIRAQQAGKKMDSLVPGISDGPRRCPVRRRLRPVFCEECRLGETGKLKHPPLMEYGQ